MEYSNSYKVSSSTQTSSETQLFRKVLISSRRLERSIQKGQPMSLMH